MKLEIIVFGITGFLIYNTYHDGKYIEILKSWQKYYKMATIGFVGLTLYLFFKRNPTQSKEMVTYANDVIKYMPIDKTTSNMIAPIFDFTMGKLSNNSLKNNLDPNMTPQMNRMMNSGGGRSTNGGTIKRSVSESKKKYVASRQSWKCDHCKEMLDATYEIDHVIELQHGGTNHIDNLVALCRNCHGKKTIKSYL